MWDRAIERWRKPLANCVAAGLALSAPAAFACSGGKCVVTSCLDDGSAGTLRSQIAVANEGDIVDASALKCGNSVISLRLGQIAIVRNNLTIQGPSATALTVDGKLNKTDGMLHHTGTGTLTIKDITLSRGYNESTTGGNPYGGCVFSKGHVDLEYAHVSQCRVSSNSGIPIGGGIYAHNGLTANHSGLYGNSAHTDTGEAAQGAGAWIIGDANISFSTISGNIATGKAGAAGLAGGLLVSTASGAITISNSTIADNQSDGSAGAMLAATGSSTVTLQNSTISDNLAGHGAAGVTIDAATVNVYNSTIVLNVASIAGAANVASGLTLLSDVTKATLWSNLIAGNSYGPASDQLDFAADAKTTMLGGSNLIRTAVVGSPLPPPHALSSACPLLGPLRNNGGPTWTHALLSHSPGIDQGSNPMIFGGDQRGPTYTRVSGSAADIGAYEVNQADVIFNSGFDGCSP